jgi:hypothetical protein
MAPSSDLAPASSPIFLLLRGVTKSRSEVNIQAVLAGICGGGGAGANSDEGGYEHGFLSDLLQLWT